MRKQKHKKSDSHIYSTDFLMTKKGFRLSDGEILEMIKRLYADEGIRYKDPDVYKNWCVTLKLPIYPKLISESCMTEIRKFFLNLDYKDDDIRICANNDEIYINLSLL